MTDIAKFAGDEVDDAANPSAGASQSAGVDDAFVPSVAVVDANERIDQTFHAVKSNKKTSQEKDQKDYTARIRRSGYRPHHPLVPSGSLAY